MDKKKQMQFNLNNFLIATSFALDFVENDIFNTPLNHAKRVAFIAIKIGIKMGIKEKELSDLCSYALCHNIGMFEADDEKEYCIKSQALIKDFPFLIAKENVLKYHREKYDGSGVFGLSGDEIPQFSQIISFCDSLDRDFHLSTANIKQRKEIIEYIKKNAGVLFSKEIAYKFLELSKNISFWLDLQNENEMLYCVFTSLFDYTVILDYEEVLKITSAFTHLTDNCEIIDMSKKMGEFYEFEHKDKCTFMIAASLKYIGKLTIPRNILFKKGSLDEEEYELIKAYPYYTNKILNNIMGFADIAKIASRIQENLDTCGYPFSLGSSELSFKDRLLSALSIYYALRSEKEHKKAFEHEKAIEIMTDLADMKKIDFSLVGDINRVFKD